MPFAMTFPAKYNEEIIIHLPKDWSIEESKDYIKTKAFRLTAKFEYLFRKVVISYEYESFQDHISPEQSEEFADALKKKEDNFSYYLSTSDNKEFITDYSDNHKTNNRIYVALGMLFTFGIIMWVMHKRR